MIASQCAHSTMLRRPLPFLHRSVGAIRTMTSYTLPRLPIFSAIASHDPSTTTIIHSRSGRAFKYGELLADVCRAREKLQIARPEGLAGERVAFLVENSYDYVGKLFFFFFFFFQQLKTRLSCLLYFSKTWKMELSLSIEDTTIVKKRKKEIPSIDIFSQSLNQLTYTSDHVSSPLFAKYIVTLLSILAARAIAVPMSAAFPCTELQYILDHSTASLLIASDKFKAKAEETLQIPLTGTRPKLVHLGKLSGGSTAQNVELQGDDPGAAAMMLYTSGTTNRPVSPCL